MIRTNRYLSVLLAVLLATSAIAPAGVAAQDDGDESFFDGLVTSDDNGAEPGLLERAIRAVADATNFDRQVAKYLGDDGNADQHASEFADEFNTNNQTILAYTNERLNASTSYDVIRLEFHDQSGNEAVRYLVATVNTTTAEYETAQVVANTSRPVDHTVSADWYVSRNAAPELETFIAEYAEPGENVTTGYRLNMLRKYGSGINGTLWGGR